MADNEIKAEVKKLAKVLCDEDVFFNVPLYQRPYAWGLDQISELFDDLKEAFTDNRDEEYFCGSIVLAKSSDKKKRLDVVDGQQRLTTFIIMCCVFRDFFQEKLNKKAQGYIGKAICDEFDKENVKLNVKSKLRTASSMNIDFKGKIVEKIDFEGNNHGKKMPTRDSSENFVNNAFGNKYLANAWFIRNEIDSTLTEHTDFNLNAFVEWLFSNVVLTVITAEDRHGAMRIFNVLNNRGMQLSPIDILKSTLMENLDDEEQNDFDAKWEKIKARYEKVDRFSFDSMMTSYGNYVWLSTTKKTLDEEIEIYYKNNIMDSTAAIDDIEKFSDAYYDAVTQEHKLAYMLRYLPQQAYPTAILATAKKHHFEDYEELLRVLVAYCYQNWIGGATLSRAKQTYVNIIKAIKENKNINDIILLCRDNLNDTRYNTAKNYEMALEGTDVYSAGWCKPILIMLEYNRTDDSALRPIKLEKSLQVEHILPKGVKYEKLAPYWKDRFTADEVEQLSGQLGNLTLLSGGVTGKSKNQEASDKSFDEKKKVYLQGKQGKTTAFRLTEEVATEYPEWNVAAIEKRQSALINKIKDYLSIEGDIA
jgi:uncharacterized protein with ParB-like and HNH nuclease domain